MFFYKFLRGSVAILGLLFGLKLTSNSVLGAQRFFSVRGRKSYFFKYQTLLLLHFGLGERSLLNILLFVFRLYNVYSCFFKVRTYITRGEKSASKWTWLWDRKMSEKRFCVLERWSQKCQEKSFVSLYLLKSLQKTIEICQHFLLKILDF